MDGQRLSLVLLLVVSPALSISGAATMSTAETTANDTDVFISDKPDPEAGSVPPFVLPDLEDVDEEENISAAELSQTRDFSYSTTQPRIRSARTSGHCKSTASSNSSRSSATSRRVSGSQTRNARTAHS